MLPLGGGEMQQWTMHPTPDWDPKWSPDGRAYSFYAYRSGNRDIWVQPLEGGQPRRLTHDEATDAFACWSPDGSEIAFSSQRGGD